MRNILFYAIPFFLVTVLLESYVSYKQKRKLVEAKDSLTSISLGIGNLIIGVLTKAIGFGSFLFVYDNFKLYEFAFDWWPIWVFTFIAEDFTFYWMHRLSHEIRYFWASHMVHHSSPNYNLAAALRQTWTSNISGMFIFYLWIPLIGVNPLILITFQQTSLLYQYWIHTEFIHKMPRWFEYVFNTPSHHRVHHATDLNYLDTNYGGVLIIWDRMFGSFQKEEQHPSYGLTTQIESYNPVKIAFYEWVQIAKDLMKANSIKSAWFYVFGPPGWSHDGSKMTVTEMRAIEKDKFQK
jgi:sterol desaturase/sphingolipid hydroxylase (fatty acid hydroxylase superfamily)